VVKVMDNSTLVFKTVTQNGRPVGAIGIIGPTRMDYRRVIATIDSLTAGVTDALSTEFPDADGLNSPGKKSPSKGD